MAIPTVLPYRPYIMWYMLYLSRSMLSQSYSLGSYWSTSSNVYSQNLVTWCSLHVFLVVLDMFRNQNEPHSFGCQILWLKPILSKHIRPQSAAWNQEPVPNRVQSQYRLDQWNLKALRLVQLFHPIAPLIWNGSFKSVWVLFRVKA